MIDHGMQYLIDQNSSPLQNQLAKIGTLPVLTMLTMQTSTQGVMVINHAQS